MKSLLNAEKMLHDQPLEKALKAVGDNSAFSQLGETLRHFEESSALTRVLENARLLEENSPIKQIDG
jgi:hypothetical protein